MQANTAGWVFSRNFKRKIRVGGFEKHLLFFQRDTNSEHNSSL